MKRGCPGFCEKVGPASFFDIMSAVIGNRVELLPVYADDKSDFVKDWSFFIELSENMVYINDFFIICLNIENVSYICVNLKYNLRELTYLILKNNTIL